MSVRMNVVVHCDEDNHDKVYIGCIRKQGGTYQVIGKWGRVGRTLSSQPKGSSSSLAGAAVIRDNVIQEKIAKGYRNIEDPSYHGNVTLRTPCVAANLEPEETGESSAGAMKEPVRPPAESRNNPHGFPGVVVCRDNTGIEDRFDDGIEYLAEIHSDPKMFYVFDKFGKKDEFLKERFVISTDDFQKPKAGKRRSPNDSDNK